MPDKAKAPPAPRTAPKEQRQKQLIEATIRVIARNGLSDLTIAMVASEAGLSQGIVNLHFKNKEGLLVATLLHIAEEYRASWRNALESTSDDPAEKVTRLIEVDFNRKVCQRNKLAVWFAFWGGSKSRPTYRKICAEHDRRYQVMMSDLCAQIIEDGPYPGVDPATVAAGLAAMSEGLWLDLLVSPEVMTPARGRDICFSFLASLFPKHFPAPSVRAPTAS